MNNILELVWITFLPLLELRASIPYGILKLQMGWLVVFIVCVIANIILGVVLYFLLDKIISLLTRIKAIEKLYVWYVKRVERKIKSGVEKYGEWALMIFIGIPLPGTGVYSGAIAAHLIGLDFKRFLVSCIGGVVIAGIIITLISVTGAEAFYFFIDA